MMNNESDIPPFSLPEHWPLIALSGDDAKQRGDLVSEILPRLHERAIRALVVKFEGEGGLSCPAPISDSDNGDILFLGSDCCHGIKKKIHNDSLQEILSPHVNSYDIIILLTDNAPLIDTVLLSDEGKTERRTSKSGESSVVHTHHRGCDCDNLVNFIYGWLQKKVYSIPVWACVLIGGKSSRMGRPKHLIKGDDGRTWLETTVQRLEKVVDRVVLSGRGHVPDSLTHLPRMVDIVDVKGPLSGILSSMRWNPLVSWLLVACDMPDIQHQGLQWLLGMRKPGVWGNIPCHRQTGYCEPLLAHYDFRSVQFFEKLLSTGCLRISQISKESKISTPGIPLELKDCWHNCNNPDDLTFLGSN